MMIAKFNGKIVQIVKVVDTVMFSEETGWIFICFDFNKIDRRREQFKWVKASDSIYTETHINKEIL